MWLRVALYAVLRRFAVSRLLRCFDRENTHFLTRVPISAEHLKNPRVFASAILLLSCCPPLSGQKHCKNTRFPVFMVATRWPERPCKRLWSAAEKCLFVRGVSQFPAFLTSCTFKTFLPPRRDRQKKRDVCAFLASGPLSDPAAARLLFFACSRPLQNHCNYTIKMMKQVIS